MPEVKKKLWGGEFWKDGNYVSTVGQKGSEETVRNYVHEQGIEKGNKQLHYGDQFRLFWQGKNLKPIPLRLLWGGFIG